jgi:hypothetical protein
MDIETLRASARQARQAFANIQDEDLKKIFSLAVSYWYGIATQGKVNDEILATYARYHDNLLAYAYSLLEGKIPEIPDEEKKDLLDLIDPELKRQRELEQKRLEEEAKRKEQEEQKKAEERKQQELKISLQKQKEEEKQRKQELKQQRQKERQEQKKAEIKANKKVTPLDKRRKTSEKLPLEEIEKILERGNIPIFLKQLRIFLDKSQRGFQTIPFSTITNYENGILPKNLPETSYIKKLFESLAEKQNEKAESIKTKLKYIFAINTFLEDGDLGSFLAEIAELKPLKKSINHYIIYEKNQSIPGNKILEKVFNYLTISDDLKKSFLEKVQELRNAKNEQAKKNNAESQRKNAKQRNSRELKDDYYQLFKDLPEDTTFCQMLCVFRGDLSEKEIVKRAGISISSYDKINRQEKVELHIKVKILKVFIQDEEKYTK